MAKPSLKASPKGLQQAHEAFSKREFTQESLAAQLGCNRSVISKFFNGENVWEKYFTTICEALEIDYQEIVYGYLPPSVQDLVEKVRTQVKELTQELCGTMRILDMTQPIELSQIYTDVNILEKLTALRRKTIDELLKECGYDDFDRFGLGKVLEKRVIGVKAVEKYKKLIVLGKPGSGKTTFLRYLAIQCNQGIFQPNLVPIFIPLKYFAEDPSQPSLFEYIRQQYSGCDVTEEELSELFKQGSALILLDGLDEVSAEYQEHTLKEVRSFSRIYFDNHFVIACRIAAWEYTFDKFTEVEIADFDDKQISEFASNWFKNKLVKSEKFIKSLKKNNRVYQLAVTPLLLTLLCLVFEESESLPNNRSESYHEGLDVLLKKWDAKRGIHRDQIYEKLSLPRKKDLLRQIAYSTFEKEKYFFTPLEVKLILKKYIEKISNHDSESNISQGDIEDLLKSMEAQHGVIIERAKGIYSFSHLTFHEYFVAKRIVSLIPQPLDEESDQDEDFKNYHKLQNDQEELQKLVKHLINRKWREIFLLVAEILLDASKLFRLMKDKADQILEGKDNLQKYLKHVNKKSQSLLHPFQIKDNLEAKKFYAAIRAFYFDIDYDIDPDRQLCFLLEPRTKYLTCGNCFTRILQDIDSLEEGIIHAKKYDDMTDEASLKVINATSADEIMRIAANYGIQSKKLRQDNREELENIMSDFFDVNNPMQENEEKLKHGADKVREVASKKLLGEKLLGVSFKDFNEEEQEKLKDYYYANNLLIDCLLQTDCLVSVQVRDEILETLFLPKFL
ncbi:NACHT domain-containing protein [Nostoc sp.]|uniref:NACHT domain-containing protein n=1 Tax=Nostoc sp. TaxID=1180 RepID=UPI002FF81DD8